MVFGETTSAGKVGTWMGRPFRGEREHLLHGELWLDQWNLVRGHEPAGVDRGKVRHDPIEGLGCFLPALAHEGIVAEGADLAVEDFGIDAIAVHGLEASMRIVVPRVREGLVVESPGQDRRVHSTHFLYVLGPFRLDGTIPKRMVLGRHVRLDLLGKDLHVRVHRDQSSRHCSLLEHRAAPHQRESGVALIQMP